MTETIASGSESMRRILLAIRVLIAEDNGRPRSRKDAAELRALSSSPKERNMRLSELACLIISREHSRRAAENDSRYRDLLSFLAKLKTPPPASTTIDA